jgi:hypothetical protein
MANFRFVAAGILNPGRILLFNDIPVFRMKKYLVDECFETFFHCLCN